MNTIRTLALSALALCLSLAVLGQTPVASKTGFKRTETGLQYKFHLDKEGPVAKKGDILKLHFALKTDKDSLLRSTFKEGNAAELPLREGPFKGCLEEGFMLMSAGDSATFLINADSLFTKMFMQPLPSFIKPGSNVAFVIKMLKVQSEEEYRKEQAKLEAELVAKEDKTIQEYMTKNNLKGTKTTSGLYYVKTQAGTGAKAESGKTVSVHYTGKLLNGTKFDSSVDRGQPFEFGLGAGQVIKGWDEGIALMSIGEKGLLLIPSALGYGTRGAGASIPPNSVLVFEVELLGIK